MRLCNRQHLVGFGHHRELWMDLAFLNLKRTTKGNPEYGQEVPLHACCLAQNGNAFPARIGQYLRYSHGSNAAEIADLLSKFRCHAFQCCRIDGAFQAFELTPLKRFTIALAPFDKLQGFAGDRVSPLFRRHDFEYVLAGLNNLQTIGGMALENLAARYAVRPPEHRHRL